MPTRFSSRSAPSPAARRGSIALAAMLGLVSGSMAFDAALADETVKIDNFTFSPETLTISTGDTVTWMNEDDIPHVVAASDRSFKSKTLDTDESFSYKFTLPGSFEYFCSLHPHMKGRIVVVAAK